MGSGRRTDVNCLAMIHNIIVVGCNILPLRVSWAGNLGYYNHLGFIPPLVWLWCLSLRKTRIS